MQEQIAEDKIMYNFVEGGPKVVIQGTSDSEYRVSFIDMDTNTLLKSEIIKAGNISQATQQYYVRWRITVEKNGSIVKDYIHDLKDKNVLISFESSALGDHIGWFPFIEEFRLKHACNILVSSFHNDIFKDVYTNFTYIDRSVPITGVQFVYKLGFFGSGCKSDMNPRDCRLIPLQAIASDILGLEYKELRTPLKRDPRPALLKGHKYVAITTCSTAAFKYYNRPNGWQQVVDWFNKRGYKVVNIGKQFNHLKNVMDLTGTRTMADIFNIIQNCEYFIGLPSGLAWVAWALKKKCVMITGISHPYCEMREDLYRVTNTNVCHGCFNVCSVSGKTHPFEKAKLMFCPMYENTDKHFECTKEITLEMIQKACLKLETDKKNRKYHTSMTDDECIKYLKTII